MDVKVTLLGLLSILSTFSSVSQAQTQAPTLDSLACIQSLCPDTNPLAHPFEGNQDLTVETVNFVRGEMQRPVQEYMGQLIRHAITREHALKDLFAKKDSAEITPEHRGFLLTLRAFKNFENYLPALERTKMKGYQFNVFALRHLIPGVSDEEITAIRSLSPLMEISRTSSRYANDPLETVLNVFYPSNSYEEALKIETAEIRKTRRQMTSGAPQLSSLQPESFVLGKIERDEALSYSERRIFLKQMLERPALNFILQPRLHELFNKIKISNSDLLRELEQAYAKSPASKSLAAHLSIKGSFTEVTRKCTVRLSAAYASFPDSQQIESLNKNLEDIKKTAQKIVSEKTKMSYTGLDSVRVLLPTRREDVISEWRKTLKGAELEVRLSTLELQKQTLQKPPTENTDDFTQETPSEETLASKKLSPETVDSLIAYVLNLSDDGLLEEASDYCSQTSPPFLNDAAYTRFNTLILSWPTVVHPETGLGIIAHELSHVIASQVGPYIDNERQCLAGKSGSRQYVEEDFADMMSTEILLRMQAENKIPQFTNFGCGTMEREKGQFVAAELENLNPADVHSSAFYRLLAIASISKTLTPACNEYLQSQKENRFETYCRLRK